MLEPLIPAKAEHIATEDRGLLWVYMRAWSALYGVVTLESTGHCDPRLIATAALFRATVLEWLGPLNLDGERERLVRVLDEELAAGPAPTG
ncbi:hypothetical protein [Nocardioides sp. TF02-7]|uniref:hypothetical protein n=1 Tax=Nocardioides sp. TF02-7 TaxID=2917724 RepID=UPI001F0541D7|nr:hypothetical protein [Nocardioides sp. TF02-7]UMG94472.1 hypothetical protein MF408_11135 [Nocardioides sp. TF02-7]